MDVQRQPLKLQALLLTLEGVAMAGYDTNLPRPTDSGSFVGLPGDPVAVRPSSDLETDEEGTPDAVIVPEEDDDTGPTLQSVPQAVPPLDRRVPMMAILVTIGGLAVALFVWRRLLGRRE